MYARNRKLFSSEQRNGGQRGGLRALSLQSGNPIRKAASKGMSPTAFLLWSTGVYIFYPSIYFVAAEWKFLELYQCVRKCKEFGQWTFLLGGGARGAGDGWRDEGGGHKACNPGFLLNI